ncbi:MAG: hypothetical protein K2G40_02045 [Muribaculaceae bacterium]|nr:hypothetical protein [Muribaculaceae bacterium]
MVLSLSGCFTGIESTKKITSRDVKKQHATTTPEMAYTADLTPDPVEQWAPGKIFKVTSDRISLITSPADVSSNLMPGNYLSFIGFSPIASMTGVDDTLVLLSSEKGDTIMYRVQEPIEQLMQRSSLEIPFTIEMSVVDKARSLLKGNEYYITTPVWFNENGDNITGLKLIPVHVDDVTAGNEIYPIAIQFTDPRGVHSRVFMSVGTGRRSTRNFDTLFSLSNPRERYKDINDDMWKSITHSRVKIDMTPQECRLAVGNPREVSRGHYLERWQYDNGLILFFDDGRLQSIRY